MDRGRGEHEQTEDGQQRQQDAGADRGDPGRDRSGDDEANHSPSRAQCGLALSVVRRPRSQMRQPAGGQGQGHRGDDESMVHDVLAGGSHHPQAEHEEDHRQGQRDSPEGPRGHRVDGPPDRPGQPPPLAQSNDQGERNQDQAQAVPAMLTLEILLAARDAACCSSGHSGDSHPGAFQCAPRQGTTGVRGLAWPLCARGAPT